MIERNDIQVGRGHAGLAKHFADGVFHDPHGPLEDRAAIHSEELAFECEGGPRDGAGVTWACGTAGNRAAGQHHSADHGSPQCGSAARAPAQSERIARVVTHLATAGDAGDRLSVEHRWHRQQCHTAQKNCNILSIFRSGKGDRPLLPERPAGCCAKGSVPFSFPWVTSIVLQFFCDEPS